MMLEGNTQGANFAETTGATGSEDNYTTESYLGRARYNYSSKYYVDFSFRRDASSRFKDPWEISGLSVEVGLFQMRNS